MHMKKVRNKLDLARARAGVRVIEQFHSTRVLAGKMSMISSKLSSSPYCVCIKASPLSLSWPIVDRRYVFSWRRTLILRSHSQLVTGTVYKPESCMDVGPHAISGQ